MIETIVSVGLSILYMFYVAVELYVYQRSTEAWVSREDCSQPRQEAFFDAVRKIEVDNLQIQKALYPEEYVEPEVSSIEGTEVEGLLSKVLSEVADLDISDNDLVEEMMSIPCEVDAFDPYEEMVDEPFVAVANDDYLTAADLHAAKYVKEELFGPVTLFATVIGKEKGYLHIADGEHRIWVKVGEQAKYFHIQDKVVVCGEFVEQSFVLDSIQPLNLISSDYEIPDEQIG